MLFFGEKIITKLESLWPHPQEVTVSEEFTAPSLLRLHDGLRPSGLEQQVTGKGDDQAVFEAHQLAGFKQFILRYGFAENRRQVIQVDGTLAEKGRDVEARRRRRFRLRTRWIKALR